MKNLILTIVAALALSCTTTSTQTIETIELDANITDYPFMDDSNIKYEIFSLEAITDDKNSIIPYIVKIIEHENRLFILSSLGAQNGVSIFNADGSYITSLKMGRARGEFMAVADINIDYKNNRLEVLDRGASAVLSYSLDGEYISKSDLPRTNMMGFCKLPNSQYLTFTPIHTFKEETDTYFKRVVDGSAVQGYLDKPKELRDLAIGSNISQSNNSIYCNGTYGNTCYKFNLDSLNLEPYIQISSVLDVDDKTLSGSKEAQERFFYCFDNVRVLNDENLFAFRVSKDRRYNLIYNRAEKTLYQNIFNEIPFLGNFLIGHNDNDEFYYINSEKIELLEESTTKSKVAQKIIDELLTKDYSAINPYIIRLSYDTK